MGGEREGDRERQREEERGGKRRVRRGERRSEGGTLEGEYQIMKNMHLRNKEILI